MSGLSDLLILFLINASAYGDICITCIGKKWFAPLTFVSSKHLKGQYVANMYNYEDCTLRGKYPNSLTVWAGLGLEFPFLASKNTVKTTLTWQNICEVCHMIHTKTKLYSYPHRHSTCGESKPAQTVCAITVGVVMPQTKGLIRKDASKIQPTRKTKTGCLYPG